MDNRHEVVQCLLRTRLGLAAMPDMQHLLITANGIEAGMRATCLEEMTNGKVKLQRATMAHRLLDQLAQLLGQLESQRGKALESVQGVVIGLEKVVLPHSCIAKYLDEDLRQDNDSLSQELPQIRDKIRGDLEMISAFATRLVEVGRKLLSVAAF
ncbi:hypothetical protein QC764_510957 [Podospora pseudoanserina]|uniref:Uncharacterized protein n=1 Tax=Podospora pseudoanserina TaxID=2609844 RepID=A0ABR0I8W7_9PEZI|nr:hypothetical protein QC764_510957 [Podospora pseudoanserina]